MGIHAAILLHENPHTCQHLLQTEMNTEQNWSQEFLWEINLYTAKAESIFLCSGGTCLRRGLGLGISRGSLQPEPCCDSVICTVYQSPFYPTFPQTSRALKLLKRMFQACRAPFKHSAKQAGACRPAAPLQHRLCQKIWAGNSRPCHGNFPQQLSPRVTIETYEKWKLILTGCCASSRHNGSFLQRRGAVCCPPWGGRMAFSTGLTFGRAQVTWGSGMPKHVGHLKTQARKMELPFGNKAASITANWPLPTNKCGFFLPSWGRAAACLLLAQPFPKRSPVSLSSLWLSAFAGGLGKTQRITTTQASVWWHSWDSSSTHLSAAAWGCCALKSKHTEQCGGGTCWQEGNNTEQL